MNRPSMHAFVLQSATPDDAPALATLHSSVAEHLTSLHGNGPWSAKTTEKGVLYAMRHSKIFVAQHDEKIIGTLRLTTKKPWAIDTKYFSPTPKPLYLLAMAIAPVHQRKGLGAKLLEAAVRIANAWPADAIRLDAYDAPAGAGKFYAKCGFAQRGRNIYRGTALIYYELGLK